MKIEKGMSLFLNDTNITEVKVEKVGRKYFYVKDLDGNTIVSDLKFRIVDMKSTGYYAYTLGLTREGIEEKREYIGLKREMESVFDWTSRKKLTLSQYRRIRVIIDEVE